VAFHNGRQTGRGALMSRRNQFDPVRFRSTASRQLLFIDTIVFSKRQGVYSASKWLPGSALDG